MTTNLDETIDRYGAGQEPQCAPTKDGGAIVVLRHESDWLAGVRLALSDHGGWVLRDVHLRHVGAGKVTAEDFRRVPFGKIAAEAMRVADAERRTTEVVGGLQLVDLELSRLRPFLRDARGGGARTDEDYAALALVFVQRWQAGERFVAKAIADKTGASTPAVWSNRFSQARKRGLLVTDEMDEPHLSPRAWALLGGEAD